VTVLVAVIGAKALYLTYGWLLCAIAASYLSERKGFGIRWGLAAGLIFTVLGVIAFLVIPARPTSDWKVVGPFGRARVAPQDLEDPQAGRGTPGGPGPTAVG
jgi:hypothetical protein